MEYNNIFTSIFNTNTSMTLGLFIVLYTTLVAPKLPKCIAILFDNSIIKLSIMFFIAYLASTDKSLAIITTVALVVSLQTLSTYKTNDMILDIIKNKYDIFNNIRENLSNLLFKNILNENILAENTQNIQQDVILNENILAENTQNIQQDVILNQSESPRNKTNKFGDLVGIDYSNYIDNSNYAEL